MEALSEIMDSGWLAKIVFILFSSGAVGGALYLFSSKNILYGAYGLLVSLMSVAGLFLLSGAEFIGVSQIMIYVGGVLVLILFGIMLSANGKNALKVVNVNNLLSLLIAGGVFSSLVVLIMGLHIDRPQTYDSSEQQINSLGMHLMTSHVAMLEIVGVLLLVVLIGASFISKRKTV
ncbi:MAG: NADH-quinone oxidoreductase subunit J [Vicingaceae bacterium]|jgi:NADH-quinone oxidoreductase subunit J